MPNADRTLNANYTTAIAQRYAALGGGASILGSPTTTEYDVAGGRARNYSNGRLYWSAATGAHWVRSDDPHQVPRRRGPGHPGLPHDRRDRR